VKDLKKYLGLIPVALFAIMLGCGGGGGGGGGNGSTNATAGGCTQVSFTAGNTNAQAGDTLYGQIVDSLGCPQANISVRLYTSANVVQAIAVTNVDGYWRANVSNAVTKADVDGTTLPNSLQKGFTYSPKIYQAATVTPSFDCKLPTPTITPGVLKPMPSQRFVFRKSSDTPLPPPDGCLP
jgi:hypothetical protein